MLTRYLGHDLNPRLKPTVVKMLPGTRVASSAFDPRVWEPDSVISLPEQSPIFLRVVPVPVPAGGELAVSGLPGAPGATLRLIQKFKRAEGTLRVPGWPAVMVRGRLEGARLTLEVPGDPGAARRILAEVLSKRGMSPKASGLS